MKTRTALILLVLGLSLIGAGMTFSSPTEVPVQKSVKVLEYTQNGTFDYSVTMKPSYFYNGVRTPTPEPNPQVPIKFIESFSLTYDFRSRDGSTKDMEINAILESPGTWKKTVNLVAKRSGLGAFIPMDLTYFQTLADTIEKELGISGGSHDLTIQAVVSTGTGPEQIQLLPIKMSRTFIKIGDNLIYSGEAGEGRFKYQIKLTENTLFGDVTLAPPEFPQQSGLLLGPSDTVFTKFIDNMKVNYSYKLEAGTSAKQAKTQVRVEAIAENPGKWNKTFVLLPPSQQNGSFSISFPLNLAEFASVFNVIQQESGVSASSEDLILQATVNVFAETNYGTIEKTFTQRIKTNLREGVMTWTGDMKKSELGSIELPKTVMEPARIFSLPLLWLRYFLFTVIGLSIIALAFSVFLYHRYFPESGETGRAGRHIGKKYKDVTVEAGMPQEIKSYETLIEVNTLEDLIKVAQSLLKPVLHNAGNGREIYWVSDGQTRYQYSQTIENVSAENDKTGKAT